MGSWIRFRFLRSAQDFLIQILSPIRFITRMNMISWEAMSEFFFFQNCRFSQKVGSLYKTLFLLQIFLHFHVWLIHFFFLEQISQISKNR